jgi:hypothetical protein
MSAKIKKVNHRAFIDALCFSSKTSPNTSVNNEAVNKRKKDIDKFEDFVYDACMMEVSPVHVLAVANFANVFYVAMDGIGKIIGFLIGDIDPSTKRGYIYVLCSEYGDGTGTRLLKTYEADAKKAGTTIIEIESLHDARGFWRKQGFEDVKRPDPKTRYKRILNFIGKLVLPHPSVYHMKKEISNRNI